MSKTACVHTSFNKYFLLLPGGRHQRHRLTHKLCNLAHAVCVILTVQYQQKPSADTVEHQHHTFLQK